MTVTDEIIPERRDDSMFGSLERHAGYMGARLGWHGWHGSVASHEPWVTLDRVGLLESGS